MTPLLCVIIILAAVAVVLSIYIMATAASRRRRRSGRQGERRVARELRRLPKRGFRVINDIHIPSTGGNTVQIDHIVVSTRGIFVVETKNHSGRICGTEHDQYWEQRQMFSSRSFYNPLLQNASHIKALRRHLRDVDRDLFVSVVVFPSAWRLDIVADDLVEHRRLLSDRHVRRTFDPERQAPRRWWRRGRGVMLDESTIVMRLRSLRSEMKRRPKLLSRNEMESLSVRIESLRADRSDGARRHKDFVRSASDDSRRKIRQGICPRCGSRLVVREGTDGPFLGCTAYPDCRFACRL